METSILFTILATLVATVIVKAVKWVWLKPKTLERRLRQQGIPGTSYKFLFGDTKDIALMRAKAMEKPVTAFSNDYSDRVDPLRKQLVNKLGKDYFVWSGPTPMIYISNPELIKEALKKIEDFQKPKLNPITDKIFPGFINYEGEKWAKHRRIINPAFHLDKLKLMLPAFYDSCGEMMNKWDNIVGERNSWSEIDVCPYLTALSADVISRAAFGSNYEEGHILFELLREQSVLGLSMLRSVYIPASRFIPTKKNRRFKEVDDEIQTLLKGIVKKRKEEVEAGEAIKNDLLGVLMDSNLNEIKQQAALNSTNSGPGMSLEQVINECKLFYIAGQETTSALLVWTMILLAKHQDWQQRARAEVLQIFGNNAPDFEALNHLKIVTMIIYEVLRLYPPVVQQTRRIGKDIELGDLLLPAGVLVNFPMLFLYRDKEIWGENADEFVPYRFAEGISKATRGNIAFFPFGWGPRICIGERFAMLEVKMALSMILQRFSFQLSPSYTHAPMTIIFLQPQHGAQIMLRKI